MGAQRQVIQDLKEDWKYAVYETPWLLNLIHQYKLDNGSEQKGMVRNSIQALGWIGPDSVRYGSIEVLKDLIRNSQDEKSLFFASEALRKIESIRSGAQFRNSFCHFEATQTGFESLRHGRCKIAGCAA